MQAIFSHLKLKAVSPIFILLFSDVRVPTFFVTNSKVSLNTRAKNEVGRSSRRTICLSSSFRFRPTLINLLDIYFLSQPQPYGREAISFASRSHGGVGRVQSQGGVFGWLAAMPKCSSMLSVQRMTSRRMWCNFFRKGSRSIGPNQLHFRMKPMKPW